MYGTCRAAVRPSRVVTAVEAVTENIVCFRLDDEYQVRNRHQAAIRGQHVHSQILGAEASPKWAECLSDATTRDQEFPVSPGLKRQ